MVGAEIAHQAAALVAVPRAYALARLADPEFVGQWSLGSMGLTPTSDGIHRGTSMFDGGDTYVAIDTAPDHGLIDFAVGSTPDLSPRIYIRITDGAAIGHAPDTCLISLNAMRAGGASDETWARTRTTHETEMLLIKAQLEAAHAREAA